LQALSYPVTRSREPRAAISWLQVLSHLDPRFGGIASSVPPFCAATQAESNYSCPIAGFCEEAELEYLPAKARSQAVSFPSDRMSWMINMGLRQRLRETIRAAQGVHIHGVWESHCAVTASIARASKRPYIISAHGMVDRWALRRKRLKKALYAALVEMGNLQRAACLRALTRDEADDYRRIGLKNPIAIVPGAVEAPAEVDADLFWNAYPNLQGQRIVLFLGRLHHKKGLHLLLQSWANVARSSGDLHLVIAGPDSENIGPSLERTIDDLNIRHSVTLAGMLAGPRKWSALAAADLFVLPSYSEGFSIAVLEALVMGLPVVVTHACHIPEVAEFKCGWVIEPEPAPLERALEEFFHLPALTAMQMGDRGKKLIEQRFCWPVVGRQMAQVYDWVLGGAKPADVEVV
jgi:glycosyltransferase involved in cell wall biosynthesis